MVKPDTPALDIVSHYGAKGGVNRRSVTGAVNGIPKDDNIIGAHCSMLEDFKPRIITSKARILSRTDSYMAA